MTSIKLPLSMIFVIYMYEYLPMPLTSCYTIYFLIYFFQIQVWLIDKFFKVDTLRYKTNILLNTEIRFNPSTFLVFLKIYVKETNKNLPNNSFMIILFA